MSNPSTTIKKLADDRKIKGIPTERELYQVISLPEIDARIRCAIMLGAACGLRLGEIQALKPKNVDGNKLYIQHSWSKVDGLKTTKTGKTRIVPLPLVILKELEILSRMNIHGPEGYYIFGSSLDAPLDCRAIERGFDNALVRLSLGEAYPSATKKERIDSLNYWRGRGITFHSLRHFANAHLRGAVPDETLRKLTGHSTEEMTDRYDHTTSADLTALAAAQNTKIIPYIQIN